MESEHYVRQFKLAKSENQVDASKDLQFEYDQLRKEILQNFALTVQTMGGALTLAGAVWAIAFSQAIKEDRVRGILFFIVGAIAFVAMFRTLDLLRSTFVIASYLKVFIEDESDGPRWESRLIEFRGQSSSMGFGTFKSTEQLIYTLLILGSLLLGSLYLGGFNVENFDKFTQSLRTPQLYLLIPWIVSIVLLWIAHQRYTEFNVETFIEVWKRIKHREAQEGEARAVLADTEPAPK